MRAGGLWFAACLCVCLAACSASEHAVGAERDVPTTSASIFFTNLEGQLEVQKARLAREPSSPWAHRDVSALLIVFARHHGDVDEVQAAIDEVSRAIELAPQEPSSYLLRAQQVQTLHRFDVARRDLEQARALGGDEHALDAIGAELDYAQGRYATSIPAIRQNADARPSASTVTRLALLEYDLGHLDEAEAAFSRAEALINDPSPIPVAWFYMQRGIVAMETGDTDRAVTFLSKAVAVAPGYVTAEEHLAEALGRAGHTDEAIARYEAIVSHSHDPEFLGALAHLYRVRGDVVRAARYASQATTGFESLIARYPEAMAAHATEFFLGEGRDPQRARTLARTDVRLRPTARAWTHLARAELACGDALEAREAIRRAQALPVRAPDTDTVAAEIDAALTSTGF